MSLRLLSIEWDSILLFTATCLLAWPRAGSRKHHSRDATASSARDADYLEKAHTVRLQMRPPRLSQFRVVCILVVVDTHEQLIFGTNLEPCSFLGNSLCAERSALAQYTALYASRHSALPVITDVYIVSDAQTPLPPGLLCREFLMGHAGIQPESTRIVLQSSLKNSKPWIAKLPELYPWPSPWNRWSVHEQIASSTKMPPPQLEEDERRVTISKQDLHNLWTAAVQAAQAPQTRRSDVLAIQYGAAAFVAESKVVVSASQLLTLEYGASQDALCQLMAKMGKYLSGDSSSSSIWLVHVDQYGRLHPPFAAARSVWAENGGARARVLLHQHDPRPKNDDSNDVNAKVVAVTMGDLAPFVPQFRN